MSANQKPDYRPAPITQRDGSTLQNANCRMASIATGLDFDTLGAKKSSGAKMRTSQDDQAGGTDSSDAKLAWARGYSENLDVQDGNTWDQLLADLKAFRMVHIDVWHATSGGCVSGTGRYGHTMAVLPDCQDNAWLVADPWCNPPRWQRISESKLKAGAEEWGRRVYGAATSGPGRDWKKNPPRYEELRAAAKALMTRFHAGGPVDTSEDPGDTGGGQRVMYTATASQQGDDMGVNAVPDGPTVAGIFRCMTTAQTIPANGAARGSLASGATRHALGPWLLPDLDNRQCYAIQEDGQNAYVAASAGTFTPLDPTPDLPPVGDCTDEVVKATDARDDAWREWLLDGAPGQRTVGATASKEGE